MKTQETPKVPPVATSADSQIKSQLPSGAPAPTVTDDKGKTDETTDIKPKL